MIHGPHPILAPWLRPNWLPKIALEEGPEELEGPCWLWLGARTADNYPVARGHGGRAAKQIYLHRISLEFRLGEELGENEADHLCPNRNCFQANHLIKATRLENIQRSSFLTAGARFHINFNMTQEDWLSLADTSWSRIASGYA